MHSYICQLKYIIHYKVSRKEAFLLCLLTVERLNHLMIRKGIIITYFVTCGNAHGYSFSRFSASDNMLFRDGKTDFYRLKPHNLSLKIIGSVGTRMNEFTSHT